MNGRVRHSCENDSSAHELMTRLYDDYYKALVGYAMQITGDKDAAEDIVQSIFQKVWERGLNMKNATGVKVYLYNGVRNMSINYLRRKRIEASYIEHVERHYGEFHVGSDGEEEFFSEEVYRLLFKKIDDLPQRQREVFLLCMEGKSYREIAEALKISADTVKSQKHKALMRLREELGDLGFLALLFIPN